MKRAAAALFAAAVLTGCGDRSDSPRDMGVVLYTIGLSTDPYGDSSPGGFGVAWNLASGKVAKVEIADRDLGAFGGADWIDRERILVPPNAAASLRSPLIFRFGRGHLRRVGKAPMHATSTFAWSPDRKLMALEPASPCRRNQRSFFDCYRPSGEIFVSQADGARRRSITAGHLVAWTPDGRIAYLPSWKSTTVQTLDLETRTTRPVLPGWTGGLPVWSSSRRYVAGRARAGIAIVRANGAHVQTISSRIDISMLAWAPVGERLAYTTSGSPDPHQLIVVDRPGTKPRLLYMTGADHFDWITWSPDGKWLLVDEEHRSRWLLVAADRSGKRRELPRLGGRPLWCCPVNAFIDSPLGATRTQ